MKDDLISRQAAIDALYSVDEYNTRSVKAIKELPPAETEIIHCCDCIYYDPEHIENNGVRYEYSDIHRAKFEGGCWRELYTWFDIPNVELWMPEPELPDEY